MRMEVELEEVIRPYDTSMPYSWENTLITRICSWPHATSCAVLFILYHSIVFQAQRLCTCACAMYSSERCLRRLLHCCSSEHLLGSTTHFACTILLFFLCLYIFVCVQPAVLGGGGGNIYYTVSSTRNRIPYIIGGYFC
jgi:hypothetical protein